MPTYYEVLDVARSADHVDVRRAYHRAARRWHPDRFAGQSEHEASQAGAEMRRVNQAWEVLGDEARRRAYDRELLSRSSVGSSGASGAATVVGDDGVIRIDPRLLDPSFLAARRHVQFKEISKRTSVVLRVAPALALLGLLAAIFVFTAYARSDDGSATTTTLPGPSLGAGIEANDCVTVLTGPSLLKRPCDPTADGQVIGARLPDGECPIATVREVELSNGAIVCLGAVL